MSFNIILQRSDSPANALTKTLANVFSLTGALKDGTSLIDPVIMVENAGIITGVNYASIADFGRQYFIKNITSVYNNMWEIALHVDVLGTYASGIKACSGIVAKQENSYNLYLNDGNYKAYQNPHIIQKEFPSGFDTSEFSFVLALCADKTQDGD